MYLNKDNPDIYYIEYKCRILMGICNINMLEKLLCKLILTLESEILA